MSTRLPERLDEEVLMATEQLAAILDKVKKWKDRYRARIYTSLFIMGRQTSADMEKMDALLRDELGIEKRNSVYELIKLINIHLLDIYGNAVYNIEAAKCLLIMIILKRPYDNESVLAGMRQLRTG